MIDDTSENVRKHNSRIERSFSVPGFVIRLSWLVVASWSSVVLEEMYTTGPAPRLSESVSKLFHVKPAELGDGNEVLAGKELERLRRKSVQNSDGWSKDGVDGSGPIRKGGCRGALAADANTPH